MTRNQWIGLGAVVLGWAVVYWWMMNRDRMGGRSVFHDPAKGLYV